MSNHTLWDEQRRAELLLQTTAAAFNQLSTLASLASRLSLHISEGRTADVSIWRQLRHALDIASASTVDVIRAIEEEA